MAGKSETCRLSITRCSGMPWASVSMTVRRIGWRCISWLNARWKAYSFSLPVRRWADGVL